MIRDYVRVTTVARKCLRDPSSRSVDAPPGCESRPPMAASKQLTQMQDAPHQHRFKWSGTLLVDVPEPSLEKCLSPVTIPLTGHTLFCQYCSSRWNVQAGDNTTFEPRDLGRKDIISSSLKDIITTMVLVRSRPMARDKEVTPVVKY